MGWLLASCPTEMLLERWQCRKLPKAASFRATLLKQEASPDLHIVIFSVFLSVNGSISSGQLQETEWGFCFSCSWEGQSLKKPLQNREWAAEPELSRTDRGEGRYQASVTEAVHRVKSLLTQAWQTFSWTRVSPRPVAIRGESLGWMSCPWRWKLCSAYQTCQLGCRDTAESGLLAAFQQSAALACRTFHRMTNLKTFWVKQ